MVISEVTLRLHENASLLNFVTFRNKHLAGRDNRATKFDPEASFLVVVVVVVGEVSAPGSSFHPVRPALFSPFPNPYPGGTEEKEGPFRRATGTLTFSFIFDSSRTHTRIYMYT